MVQNDKLEVIQFPCRTDNFGLLVYDPKTLHAISIDTPEEQPIIEKLMVKGLTLTHILNTHHHYDHVEANEALKKRFGCEVIGAALDKQRIPAIDKTVCDGDVISFCGHEITVFETPGHTMGHLSYWISDSQLLFTGDTLFSMGCGRLFEGNGEIMWQSMEKLLQLPPETLVYCAHEYTMSNGEFALEIEPNNRVLQQRMSEVRALRRNRKPTLPVTLELECATNPFLRPDSVEIQKKLGLEGESLPVVFSKIRALKDRF